MPRIVLKPNSPEFADPGTRRAAKTRRCEMPGCQHAGEYRAPKSRVLNEHYWFCLPHVQEFNQAWNYFAGMSDREVEDHIVRSMLGDRPTRRYDAYAAAEALRRTAWQEYHFTRDAPEDERRTEGPERGTPEYEALCALGLRPPVTFDEIKAQYKALVKKHHPDVNAGDPKCEALLKTINMAYTILRTAYERS